MNNTSNIKFKIFEAERAKQILLCLHGFGGDKESSVIEAIGTALQKDNISTIAFDLPCHGEDENTGTFRVEKCLEYLSEVIKQIRQFNMPINIFATSFGAYLFLHYLAASGERFENIILRSPAIDMQHIIFKIIQYHNYGGDDVLTKPLNLGYERELKIDKHFVKSLKLPQPSSQNVFINIIQGKKDELVDWEFNEKYFKKYYPSNRIYYFENADHRYKNPGEKEEIVKLVRKILTKK